MEAEAGSDRYRDQKAEARGEACKLPAVVTEHFHRGPGQCNFRDLLSTEFPAKVDSHTPTKCLAGTDYIVGLADSEEPCPNCSHRVQP